MGYDFETDKKYNSEKNVSITIELNKTCFSRGEMIIGKIILQPKEGHLNQTQLLNPYALISIYEKHYYEYREYYYDDSRKTTSSRTRNEVENIPLLSIPMEFTNFMGANILLGIQIPFEIKTPETAYPSCIFGTNEYVKHFLTIEIPSLEAKRTEIIVVKNNIYFSNYNGLLKAPCCHYLKTTKYKYAFFNYGSFNSTITLSKNIFAYNEAIPFVIDIECSQLSIDIRELNITLYRKTRNNYSNDHTKKRSERNTKISNKTIPLIKEEKMYHVEDAIQMPKTPIDLNPKETYNILDNDKRKYNEKYKNIKLFPTCYGGLLSCEYYLTITFVMNSWFTTNEEVKIPLDLYEPFIINNNYNYNSNIQPFMQQNYIYNNNIINSTVQPNQTIEKPSINNMNINNNDTVGQEDELPSEEEVNRQNYINNNNNPDDEDNKDGSAPPPNCFMPDNNK